MSVKTLKFILFSLLLFTIGSCKDSNGKSFFKPNRIEPPSIQDRTKASQNENVGRYTWQKPELIINKLGDIQGKTIADIGAGTGYFVIRLASKEADVLAVDIDPVMINYIDSVKELLPTETQARITTRLAKADDPMLKEAEVDIAIIINTVSYIAQLEDYLTTLKQGIKPEGTIMILDYKNKIIDIPAPPLDDRISIGRLQTYLANAGYKNIIVDDTSLEYQYIITAKTGE